MPSKDHIDGDHPPHSQSFHQSLCTCDPCKALTKRTLMASPHAVDIRELEILSAVTRSSLDGTVKLAEPPCSFPTSSTSTPSKRPFSTTEKPASVPAALRWRT